MSGYRPEYTQDEEKKIVDYIVENDSVHLIKGDRLWRDIEEAGVVDRTWQSLKQHFRRHMIYQLHFERYGLDERTVANFRDVFNKPPSKKNSQNKSKSSKAQGKSKGDTEKRKVANILELDSSTSDESN